MFNRFLPIISTEKIITCVRQIIKLLFFRNACQKIDFYIAFSRPLDPKSCPPAFTLEPIFISTLYSTTPHP